MGDLVRHVLPGDSRAQLGVQLDQVLVPGVHGGFWENKK
jgi:hypothetical protein